MASIEPTARQFANGPQVTAGAAALTGGRPHAGRDAKRVHHHRAKAQLSLGHAAASSLRICLSVLSAETKASTTYGSNWRLLCPRISVRAVCQLSARRYGRWLVI